MTKSTHAGIFGLLLLLSFALIALGLLYGASIGIYENWDTLVLRLHELYAWQVMVVGGGILLFLTLMIGLSTSPE